MNFRMEVTCRGLIHEGLDGFMFIDHFDDQKEDWERLFVVVNGRRKSGKLLPRSFDEE